MTEQSDDLHDEPKPLEVIQRFTTPKYVTPPFVRLIGGRLDGQLVDVIEDEETVTLLGTEYQIHAHARGSVGLPNTWNVTGINTEMTIRLAVDQVSHATNLQRVALHSMSEQLGAELIEPTVVTVLQPATDGQMWLVSFALIRLAVPLPSRPASYPRDN